MVGLLRQIAETGTTVIMVTHSLELAVCTDRTVVMRDGRIVDSITHAN